MDNISWQGTEKENIGVKYVAHHRVVENQTDTQNSY